MGDIKKALKFMVDTANDNTHGYDQAKRNSPDYDCSSLLGTALNKAGFTAEEIDKLSQTIKEIIGGALHGIRTTSSP